VTNQLLRSWGLVVLVGGLLAGSLTGCAARRLRTEETATAAAGQQTTASANPGNATAPANANPADQIDAELDKLNTELNNADTINDFTTALPPEAASTPAAQSPTVVPATLAVQPTTAASGNDQGDQIDQLLAAMQNQLNKTDTVPAAAKP